MVQEGENIEPWTGTDSEHFIEIDGRRIEVTVEDAGVEDDRLRDDVTSTIKRLRSGDTTPDLPLAPHIVGIAFEGAITPALLDRAGAILLKHPDIRVQTDGTITNLDFLTDLPPVRDLTVILGLDLANVDALAAHASSLSYLHLETGLPALDVAVLGELSHLQQMYLHKRNRALKGLAPALAPLTQLRHLTLHSITLPNPDPLLAISGLRGLVFKLGGNRDLHYLTDMRELRFLEVWGVSKFRDTAFLADCHQLRAIYLQDLPHAVLPDMSQAIRLTDVHLINLPTMSGHMLVWQPHRTSGTSQPGDANSRGGTSQPSEGIPH